MDTIVMAIYSDYPGRTIRISYEVPNELNSFLEGSQESTMPFMSVSQAKCCQSILTIPSLSHAARLNLACFLQGYSLLTMAFFGKEMGLLIYANQDYLTPLLLRSSEPVSLEEVTVL